MKLFQQKGKQALERYSEGCIVQKMTSRKVNIRKLLLMKSLILKASFAQLKVKIQKVKYDLTRSKRSTDKFEKLVNTSTTIFRLLCHFYMLKKKAVSSLFNLRLVDQRGTRLKICKLQRSYFEVYIKLEVKEKCVRLIEYSLSVKRFLQSSQPFELLYSYIL